MDRKKFVLSLFTFIILGLFYSGISTYFTNPKTNENPFAYDYDNEMSIFEEPKFEFPYIVEYKSTKEIRTLIFMTKWYWHHFFTCVVVLCFIFLYRVETCGKLYKIAVISRTLLVLLVIIFFFKYLTFVHRDIHIGASAMQSIYQDLYTAMVVEPAFLWLSGVLL